VDCDCLAVAVNASLSGFRIQVKSEAHSQDGGKSQKRSSSAQREDHVHRGLHFHWFVVEQVGPVAPGPDGLKGGLLQHGRTADDVQVSIDPVLEIVACRTTVPETRAAWR